LLSEAEAEAEADLLSEAEALAEAEAEGDKDLDAEALSDADADADGLRLGLTDDEGVKLANRSQDNAPSSLFVPPVQVIVTVPAVVF